MQLSLGIGLAQVGMEGMVGVEKEINGEKRWGAMLSGGLFIQTAF